MTKKFKKNNATDEATLTTKKAELPISLGIAEKGIRTSGNFSALMSAVMSDTIAGRMTPPVCNAVVNAGGKLLKVVELQIKYGKPRGPESAMEDRVLVLVPPDQAVS